MNFKRMDEVPEHRDHLYKCLKCGEETWYIGKMPDHLLYHVDGYRRCNGKQIFITTRGRAIDRQECTSCKKVKLCFHFPLIVALGKMGHKHQAEDWPICRTCVLQLLISGYIEPSM